MVGNLCPVLRMGRSKLGGGEPLSKVRMELASLRQKAVEPMPLPFPRRPHVLLKLMEVPKVDRFWFVLKEINRKPAILEVLYLETSILS